MTAALQPIENLMTPNPVPSSSSDKPPRQLRAPGAERAFRFSSLVLLAYVLGIAQDAASAKPKQVDLRWGDLSPMVGDKRVTLRLPEEVTVKGRVLAVRDDGLYIDIKKRNKKKAYPKGPTVIPRADVSLIELRQKRSFRYRGICTSTGAVLSLGLGITSVALGGAHVPYLLILAK